MGKTISFSNLSISIEETSKSVLYTFEGDVDENFRHQDVPRIKKQSIILVLGKIQNFNSVGIREWIHFIQDLSRLGTPILRECSVSVIDQVNMVPESLAKGKIESFYAPYYCDCGKEVNKLIHIKDCIKQLKKSVAPSFKCDSCDKELEFDALEESYFQFISSSSSEN